MRAMRSATPASKRTGSKRASRRVSIATPSFSARLGQEPGQPLLGLLQQALLGVAQVDGELGARRDHVDRLGWSFTEPTVATWLPPISSASARTKHVTAAAPWPASWRRRIGVVPAWFDWPVIGERLPRNALQVAHRADRDAVGIEHGALLDVQLDEGVRPA